MSMAEDFATFWNLYPKKVARLAAEKAYQRARKIATADEILAGLDRYRQHMSHNPQYRPHASTWLNGGRWLDRYDDDPPIAAGEDWFAECTRVHGGTCNGRYAHYVQTLLDEARAEVKHGA
jgi:hypothetical protein